MNIESPPLVMYGTPTDSSGALLSGIVNLNVVELKQQFDSMMLRLEQTIERKRGTFGCQKCGKKTEVLNTWRFLQEPVLLEAGAHGYPFSFLFPGHLPATSDNALSRVTYTLVASATTIEGDEISYVKPIKLERAVLPGPEKHSIRIFPPTNLSATLTLPSVVHPGGDFPLSIRLDGVVNSARNTRWRLRKTSWRIEEQSKISSQPCEHHAPRVTRDFHEDVRIIGNGEIKRGWKSDFSTADGKVELDLTAGIPAYAEASCKLDTPCGNSGISVAHVLVVEMIVAEEYATSLYTRGNTPTGAARVLRMQFHLTVTSRAGLGISWDEEQPPVYENVPTPPPDYSGVPSANKFFQYADFSEVMREEDLPQLRQTMSLEDVITEVEDA